MDDRHENATRDPHSSPSAADERRRRRTQLAVRLAPAALVLVALAVYTGLGGLSVAALLVGMVLWHEYGHVLAARRVGVRSRGIFVIPFIGGVAALDSLGRTRDEQVQIALGGPLFGLVLCVIAFFIGLLFDTGGFFREALLLWSALNLFNLLPIHPLDGGRVVHGLANSLHPFAGVAVAGFGAAVSSAFALFLFGVPPLFLLALLCFFVAAVGINEFLREYRLYQRFRALRDDPPAADELSADDTAVLRLFVSGRLPGRMAALYLAVYVLLGMLYGTFFLVARYSPHLESSLLWGVA